MSDPDLCEHGFPFRFKRPDGSCGRDAQPDGATLTDLAVLDTYEITGRGTGYAVEHIGNKKALLNRVINLDGVPMKVIGYESCLIPGHDESHCTCFGGAGILAKPVEEA